MAMKVLHNTCNIYICDLPDINTFISWACGPQALGIHITQISHAHVTTITYNLVITCTQSFLDGWAVL